MPNAIIRPAAVGSYDSWLLAAGANKVVATDPGDALAHDDLTTYISSATNNAKQAFTALCTGSPVIGLISSITINARDKDNTGAMTIGLFVRVAGVDGVRQTWTQTSTDVWTNRVITNPLKNGSVPVSGPDFVWSDTNFQMVLEYVANSGSTTFVTSVWMALTYSAPTGGWESLVAALAIAGLLGAAISLAEMPKLAHEIALRSRGDIQVMPHEYAAMYRELREGRHAKHFILRRGL